MDQEERKMLEVARDMLITNETRLYEHVAAMFRWLLATLFAADGGAMVALLGHDKNLPRQLNGYGQALRPEAGPAPWTKD